MVDGCLFCKIAKGEIPAEVVYEDDACFAFRDVNPKAPVHVLVIPKSHSNSIYEMKDKELLGDLLLAGNKVAACESIQNGYRFVLNTGETAGQTVFHTHLHVLGGRQMNWPPG